MAYLKLPDGSYFQFDDALSDEQAYATAQRKFPAAFGIKPQEGMGAAWKKGVEQFISSGGTGIRSLFGDPVAAARQGVEQQQDIGNRYADQVGWDRVRDRFNAPDGGFMSAAGEVARQVPLALAEQAPNIAASMAGAKVGAMGGAAVAPFLGPAAPAGPLIGGALGAMAPSFVQQLGGNVVRQEEATPGQVSVGKAAAAAAPQAALDAAATFIPLGKTVIGKLLGPEAAKYLARGGEQAAEKLARETLLKTMGKGLAVGAAAEIPTEITQQMLERLQAGLPLTTPDALKEYGETAYQTGLLAPIGAAGRAVDRSAAKSQVAETGRVNAAKAAAEAAKADAERKQTPEYLQDLTARYDAAVQAKGQIDAQIKQLQASLKEAPATEKRDIVSQIRQLKLQQGAAINELKPLQIERDSRLGDIKALQEQQRLAGMDPMEVLVGQQAPQGVEPDTSFVDMAQAPVQPATPPAQRDYLQEAIRALEDPNAAAVGENTLSPQEVVAALVQRPDLAMRLINGGQQFPGTASRAESSLWKRELAKQVKAATAEPPVQEDSTAAMQQIIGDREAMDREALAEQMSAVREQSEQRRAADEAQAAARQRQAAELNATSDTADEIGVATRAQGMQLGDSRRTPNTVKQLENAIDEGILTPTVARALRIGELADPLNLSDPRAAAQALPRIQARLQELVDVQQQTLANERVKLTEADGTPTRNAAEMQRVEANLAELRRLEAHAKRALDPNALADESFVQGALENATPRRTPSVNVGQQPGLQPQQYGSRAAELSGRHEELVTDLYSQLDELARGTFFKSPDLEQRSPADLAFDSNERVRKPDTKRAMSLEKSLVERAEALKREIVKNTLQEAAMARDAQGLPGLTQQEAGAAARDIRNAIDALIDQARRVDDSERIWEDDPSQNRYVTEASGKTWTIGGRRKTTAQKVRGRTDPAYAQVRMQKNFTDAAGVANEILERTRDAILNPPKKPGLADAVKTKKPVKVEGVRKAAFDLAPQTEERAQLMEKRARGENLATEGQRINQRIENAIDRIERAQAQIRAGDYGGMRETAAVLEKARRFLLGTTEGTLRRFDPETGEEGAFIQARARTGAATPQFMEAVDAALERVSKGQPVDPDTGRAIIEHINSIESNRQDGRFQEDMFSEPIALVAKDNAQLQRMQESRRRSEGPDNPKFQQWLSRLNENIERAEKEIEGLEQKYEQFESRGYNTKSVQDALAELRNARSNLASLKDQRTVLKSINKPELDGNKSSLVREVRKVNEASAEMQKAIAKAQAQSKVVESQSRKEIAAAGAEVNRVKDALRKVDERDNPAAYKRLKQQLDEAQERLAELEAVRNVKEGRLREPAEQAKTSQPKQAAPGTSIVKQTVVTPDIEIKRGKQDYVASQPTYDKDTGEYVEPAKVRVVQRGVVETPEQKREALKAKIREQMEDRARQKKLKEELRSQGVAREQTREEKQETARAMVGASRSKGEEIRKNIPSMGKGAPEKKLRTPARTRDKVLEDDPVPSRAGQPKTGASNTATLKQRVEIAEQERETARERLKAELARKKKFSEGVSGGSTVDTVQANVYSLLGPDAKSDAVQIVKGAESLPPSLRKGLPADAKAVTVDGEVYLIADRLAPGEARGVVLHELGVHVGMDSAAVGRLHAEVERLAAGGDAMAKAALEAQKQSSSTDARDEGVAYYVELLVNSGVDPSTPPGGLAKFLKPLVDAVKKVLTKLGMRTDNLTPQDIVDFAYGAARKALTERNLKPGTVSFSQKVQYAKDDDPALQALDAAIIARPTPVLDTIKANILGFRAQFIDRLDPLEKIASTMEDSLKATQMMYWGRMYGQRNNFMAEVSANGPLRVEQAKRQDGRTEYMVKSKSGASLRKIADILRDSGVGNADAVDVRFKTYLIAERAERTGFNSVVGYVPQGVTEADLKKALAAGRANPAFQKARAMYQEYNDGLIDFAVQTGALSEDLGKLLKSSQDYVSFYRKDGDSISLIVDGEKIGTMGSLKNQPYLQELVGGDNQITGFFDGALRNTHLLTDMALRNIATRNTANTLQEIGLAKIGKGAGPAAKTTIRFREHGQDRHAVIDTDTIGIPPELVAYGMEGISTQLPAAFKMLGVPARLLRHFIVRNPVYAFRQVFRDSVANVLMTGATFTPVVDPMKQMVQMWRGKSDAEAQLQERGVVGGQVITGDIEDRATILKQLQSGGLGWRTAMAKLDFLAMQADAASRVSAYNSFREQGLSDMEATLATLETMNFNRRGVSPTIHAMGTMIPFMNAQIQGLDVLYRAMRGRMPFADRLQVRRKFYTRGLMIAASTMMYASLMQDDEDYKNASADERYNNWFVPIPGTDQKLKVPIPFEPGYLFKSIPEAVYNTAFGDESSRNVLDAFMQMGMNTMPGVIPQGVKPLIEAVLNRNFFTGREIEDVRMQGLKMGERYGDRTTDLAKALGGSFEIAGRELGMSPAMIEHLVRGYTGSLGMAIMGLSNALVTDRVEKPTLKVNETPVLGAMFLERDATGAVTEAYKQIEAVGKVKATFEKLVKEGRGEEALKFAEKYADQIAKADVGASVKKQMGDLTKLEQQIRSSDMPAQEKRSYLDDVRRAKIELSRLASEALRR